jgi:cytochrome c5
MFKRIIVLLAVASFVFGLLGLALAERSGKEIYESSCKMCHATGISGAPKFGDKIWIEHEKSHGMDEFMKIALEGKNAMPPKGACMDCSEAEIKAAIRYMIDSAK